MSDVLTIPDDLGRAPIPLETKARIREAFAAVPARKRGALLVMADTEGRATATLAGKLGDHWKVAGGAAVSLRERRPSGYVAVEASW